MREVVSLGAQVKPFDVSVSMGAAPKELSKAC